MKLSIFNVLIIFGEISVEIFYMYLNLKWSYLNFSDFQEIFKGLVQLSFKCCYSVAETNKIISYESWGNRSNFFISHAISFWISASVDLYKTLNHEPYLQSLKLFPKIQIELKCRGAISWLYTIIYVKVPSYNFKYASL